MIEPLLVLDSRELWLPCAVDTLLECGATVGPLSLKSLGQLAGAAAGDTIDMPKMVQPDVPPVGYHRVKDGGSLWWHQFWTWWLYNPKRYAGFGEHEGDWEMVQLGCRDPEGNVPILMTFSQHGGGEKREFWRTELGPGGRPFVYVARDSHAGYPGQHRDVTDIADGKGKMLVEMEWREFGDWASYPGRWGNSENSPGPLTTRRAWVAPHAYHAQARG
jgi:hypothetical protein